MAANRTLDTSFWDDRYVSTLTPLTRYFYLYLKLNKHIQVSGCCQLKEAQMAVETGLDLVTIRLALDQLEKDNKIRYQDDWLAVADCMQDKGAKLKSAVDGQLAQAPEWVGDFLHSFGESGDTRATHPAIAAFRDVANKFPPKKEWDDLIAVLGEEPDIEHLKACHAEWARRGYNPYNHSYVYDWYVNGLPKEKRTNASLLEQYRETFRSQDRSDH